MEEEEFEGYCGKEAKGCPGSTCPHWRGGDGKGKLGYCILGDLIRTCEGE